MIMFELAHANSLPYCIIYPFSEFVKRFLEKFFDFFKKSLVFGEFFVSYPFIVHKSSLNCPFSRIFFRQNGKTMWYYDVTPSSLPIRTKISFHYILSFVFHPLIFIKNSDKKHHLTTSSKG